MNPRWACQGGSSGAQVPGHLWSRSRWEPNSRSYLDQTYDVVDENTPLANAGVHRSGELEPTTPLSSTGADRTAGPQGWTPGLAQVPELQPIETPALRSATTARGFISHREQGCPSELRFQPAPGSFNPVVGFLRSATLLVIQTRPSRMAFQSRCGFSPFFDRGLRYR